MTEILLTRDLETCRLLRRRVFIEEQQVSEEDEIDDLDEVALHLLARDETGPLGTARLVIAGDTGWIGRVCVLREARGRGIGRAMMQEALAVLAARPGVRRAELGAQIHALGFYEALGFTAYGPEYEDAGIPHRDMERML